MINEHDLHLMRHTIQHLLGDLCSIQAFTDVPDGYGGMTRTWSTIYSNVPCQIAPDTSSPQNVGEKYFVVTGWTLTLYYDQPIVAGNRVVKGGDTFSVIAVEDDRSRRICRRASLRRDDD